MNKSRFAASLLGTLSFLALLGCAQNSFAGRLLDVTIINRDTGERLKPYRYDGKLYVAGTPGERYAVELKSRRGERVLTVLSVDGINVLTGQTAAPLQSGYVVDGWQSYSISGWRKTMDDVAQFVFTALPNSYAARTGRPDNVGVIGVAAFLEKIEPPPQPVAIAPVPAQRAESARDAAKPAAAPASGNEASAGKLAKSELAESREASPTESESKAKRLGTGHGEREYATTRYTEFVRQRDTPDEIITIYYDSRASLVARGIIPAPRLAEPVPFPAGVGFVPDPRG